MPRPTAQLGQFLPLPLLVESKTTKRTVGTPDAAPTYSIYDNSGTAVVEDQPLPRWTGETSGLFGMDLLIDTNYSAGAYCAHFKWQEGGTANARILPFEVLPGSPSGKGVYTSLTYYDRPHAKFLVGATEDGTVEYRRNPYLT